jgi:hypothetical protein
MQRREAVKSRAMPTICTTLSAFAQRMEVGDGSAAYDEMEHACIPVSDAIRDDADKALRSDSDWLQAGWRAGKLALADSTLTAATIM